jgi:hypothetical protein
MRSKSLFLAAMLVGATAGTAPRAAARHARIELTLMIGYRWGGGCPHQLRSAGFRDLDTEDNISYGGPR